MRKNRTIIFRCESELKERIDEMQNVLGKKSTGETIRGILDYFLKFYALGKANKTIEELEQELLETAKRIQKSALDGIDKQPTKDR